MIIHVVRHAEAIERSDDIPEEHRFLTPRGRKRFRKVAEALDKAGASPDVILTSPLIRAVQTADILGESLRHKGELQLDALLAPGFRPESLDDLLDNNPQAKEIAIVGHEPDTGHLVQSLLGVKEGCTLKKGAVVTFERTAGDHGKAAFIQLVTGGGKVVTSRSKALGRLTGEQQQ